MPRPILTRLQQRLNTLQKHYGSLPEPPSDAFELFVWEALSPHATAAKRDSAFAALKRRAC